MAGIVTLESETQLLGTVGTRPELAPAVSLRRIVAAGTTFDEAGSVSEVLDRLDRALADLLDVGLVGAEATLGDPLVDDAVRSWCPSTAGRHGPADVALPVTVGDRHLGSVSVAMPTGHALRGEEIDACAALVSFAAGALVRIVDQRRMRARLQEADVLRRLSDVVARAGGILPAIQELNRSLPDELGISLQGISVANAALRASVGGEEPDAAELEAIRSWRAILARGRSPLRPRHADALLLVPVAHGTRVLGALRVVPTDGGSDVADELLLAVGTGLAEVVHRAGLQREVAESERRLAVAAERERIAHDLHDSVGQIITGMGMRLAHCLADAPDRTWRARLEELLRLAGRGNREIRQAIHELLFLDARRDGLVASVRELVRTFEVTTGLPLHFVVTGTPTALAANREDALFRAAHEALVNVERHARASMATVELTYDADAVVLAVRDDGVGLGHRDPFGAEGGHFGIRAMQQRLVDAGGELRVGNARPRGVVVEAEIARARRSPRGTRARRRRR
jgi:signal transduction histidine kinase